jgi:hypothetical protein
MKRTGTGTAWCAPIVVPTPSSVEPSIEPYGRNIAGVIEAKAEIALADEPFYGRSATAIM